MEVPGVESDYFAGLSCISCVEVARSHSVAFESDAKHLRFKAILHIVVFLCKNLVERVLEQAAIEQAVNGDVLAAIVNPKVHDARVALTLTHLFSHGAATLGVLNPEVADALIGIGER